MAERASRRATAGTPTTPSYGIADLAEFQARMDRLWETLDPPAAVGAFHAYTDGACLRNPEGPGGWAGVVTALDEAGRTWELWGSLSSTSNNRAEALGMLASVEWVPAGSALLITSDSELSINVLMGRYKAKANRDLWDVIRGTIQTKRLQVTTEWVRGHAGEPGNERADELAGLGAVNGGEHRLAQVRAANPGRTRPGRGTGPARQRAGVPVEIDGLEPHGPWEASFLQSIARQLLGGRQLSEKQQAIVDRIRARAAG